MDIVADSELKGPEAEKVWREAIEEWPSRSRLSVELGVRKTARARLETEEREPLLLLPDYVAGIYHHADPRTRLARPIVTPKQAFAGSRPPPELGGDGSMGYHVATLFGTGGIRLGMRPPGR
jgi:hypothetical protein